MCFSASISFGASALLGAAGGVAMTKAKTTTMNIFALAPIFLLSNNFLKALYGCL
jgi:hypothetical protein